MPTLIPSSISVGATESARSTTNLANCFTLMMYLGSSESALMILVHLATCRGCSDWRLLVCREVPEGGGRQPGVGLLDPRQLVDPLGDLLDVGLHLLQGLGVLTLAVGLHQGNVPLVQDFDLLLLLLLVGNFVLSHIGS